MKIILSIPKVQGEKMLKMHNTDYQLLEEHTLNLFLS
jgi:hypothetical protein